MKITRLRVISGLAATVTLPAWPGTAQAQTVSVVRAAMIPNEPAALIYYASENGYFSKAVWTCR